jgi:hypothetical protein
MGRKQDAALAILNHLAVLVIGGAPDLGQARILGEGLARQPPCPSPLVRNAAPTRAGLACGKLADKGSDPSSDLFKLRVRASVNAVRNFSPADADADTFRTHRAKYLIRAFPDDEYVRRKNVVICSDLTANASKPFEDPMKICLWLGVVGILFGRLIAAPGLWLIGLGGS